MNATVPGLEGFTGVVLVLAPHMDDEILACGGLIALLRGRSTVHVIYATDGRRSPAPVVPLVDAVTEDLYEVRRQESIAAADLLGVPARNLHFLGFPEADLERHEPALEQHLADYLRRLQPSILLTPFRFDRHPDHLTVNRAAIQANRMLGEPARLLEYFVYHRWRLLPGHDLRSYVRPECVLAIDIAAVAAQKRAALACFKSQTTHYFKWQTRPILQSWLLDEECNGPEQFVEYRAALPGARVFSRAALWIRLVHGLEPRLQRLKYVLTASVQRATRGNA